MPEQQDRGYEDSSQKRDRLISELQTAIKSIKNNFIVFRNDSGILSESSERAEIIYAKLNGLFDEEDKLWEDVEKQNSELDALATSEKDIDDKIDSSLIISSKISESRERILEITVETEALLKEMEEIADEVPGQLGGFKGTVAVIKMQMEDIEKIKKQLDEIDQ